MNATAQTPTRRTFLRGFAAATALAATPRTLRAQATVVAEEKWARIEQLAADVWAVVSKPLEGSFETVCNGGIVAGRDRVVAFDAYASSQGAAWVAEQAKALTGRLPTDVVLSHHHGDHTAGLAGFAAAGDPPRVWLTEPMRERLRSGRPPAGAEAMLEEAAIVATSAETRLDLGGSNLVLRPLSGHTPSDVVATIGDRVTFCGDLIWNRLFPNYVDATPIELGRSVDALLEAHSAVRVPGHGPLFAEGELATYRRVLAEVEAAARAAHQAGTPAAEAAQAFSLPGSLGTWTLFSPSYFEVAFRAWHRQLAG